MMHVNLEPLVESLAQDLPAFGPVAFPIFYALPRTHQAWPAMAVWLCRAELEAVPADEFNARKTSLKIINAYQHDDEDETSEAEWEVLRLDALENSLPGAAEAIRVTMPGRYSRRERAEACAKAAANSIDSTLEPNQWRERRELQAAHLLLCMQLQRPARHATEAALQQRVAEDEHLLPIYCDWLEEYGDSDICDWLRRIPAMVSK